MVNICGTGGIDGAKAIFKFVQVRLFGKSTMVSAGPIIADQQFEDNLNIPRFVIKY